MGGTQRTYTGEKFGTRNRQGGDPEAARGAVTSTARLEWRGRNRTGVGLLGTGSGDGPRGPELAGVNREERKGVPDPEV